MNYSDIIGALNSATGFDLFRINTAINRMLDDPKRIEQLKCQLQIGQEIEYFEPNENRIIKATVIKFKRAKVEIKNIDDGVCWTIPYYFININEVDTNISRSQKQSGLDRNEVKVGDKVGFIDGDNIEHYGDIVRLNPKTVTLHCDGQKWRVAYSFLFNVINTDIDVLSVGFAQGN
jgi:hypothetical protein